MNILFTNAGRRTYLIKYALEIATTYKDINIFVSDASDLTAAFHVDKSVKTIITPFVSSNEDRYLASLLKECKNYQIDLLIPLMDFELPILSMHTELFNDCGTKVIVSTSDIVEMCLEKDKTSTFCMDHSIPYPKIYHTKNAATQFPLIAKKREGSGSVGLHIVSNQDELVQCFDEENDIIQDYVSGQEYGMDILNDLDGNFLHACVKKKLGMRAGETDKAETFFSRKYELWARRISAATRHIGKMDVDFIETDDGEVYFIDFNPRFGGGYPFTHITGFNYLDALIKMVKGETVSFEDVVPNWCVGMKGIDVFYVH